MSIARVLNPVGLKSKVCGSSFIVERKTKAAPEDIPEKIKGKVIFVNVFNLFIPNPELASK